MTQRIKRHRGIGTIEENLFSDTQTGRAYGRIVAGIGWASDKPGAVVVVGQECNTRPVLPLFVLGVYQGSGPDLDQLIRKALEMEKEYLIQEFEADTFDKDSMNYLNFRNQTANNTRKGGLCVYPGYLAESGDLAFHLNLIKGLLGQGNKTLFLEGFTEISGALSELSNAHGVKFKESPLLTALGFAVAELTNNPWSLESSQPKKAISDYDLFG